MLAESINGKGSKTDASRIRDHDGEDDPTSIVPDESNGNSLF
jgi:hypothetical protein